MGVFGFLCAPAGLCDGVPAWKFQQKGNQGRERIFGGNRGNDTDVVWKKLSGLVEADIVGGVWRGGGEINLYITVNFSLRMSRDRNLLN